ncbi:hypothetical protein [Nocardioides ferulae]|uniref:hypothetical protein n=1 Tax=Nocardioides ferulae TaxID=2340821 RepID=UPI000EB2EAE7|nr:hypothetical protein [Nocardioides ferulae]
MRLPPIPGPGDVARTLDQLVSLVPRASRLLSSAEELLTEARGLLDRVEATRTDADRLVRSAGDTRAEANRLVKRVEVTRSKADDAIGDLQEPFRRLVGLLDALEPPLLRLQPVLERLAETTTPAEVDAAVGLVDRLPALTDRVEGDVLPVLGTLATVAPDLHDLLAASRELNELLGNVPGMGRVRKKLDNGDSDD